MSAIRPLEFTESLDLRVLQRATIDVEFTLTGCPRLPGGCMACALYSTLRVLPSLVAFASDLPIRKHATDLDCSPFKLLDSFASHLVSDPIADVLRAI